MIEAPNSRKRLLHRQRRPLATRWPAVARALVVTVLLGGLTPAVAEEEVANGTLAAAIRSSGQPCARVIEKEHQEGSQWVVRCNSGRFQVLLNEDSTAEVTALD